VTAFPIYSQLAPLYGSSPRPFHPQLSVGHAVDIFDNREFSEVCDVMLS